ncbi:MAG: hypothetical protein J7L54_01710 [Elusimicrobia bacterium]|nr:hypothetical protein [Elusimicrobiota bacterium]
MKTKIRFSAAAFSLGFSAMVSQIVFLRSFLSVFSGNEMTIGIIIAFWLLGAAFGSAVLGKSSGKIKNKSRVISSVFFILGFLIPLGILEIGAIRPVFGFVTGEILRFFPVVLSTAVILIPVCGLFGLVFVLLSGAFPGLIRRKAGFVYFFEAAGSLTGGLAANFIFIKIFNPLETAVIAGIACLIAAALTDTSFFSKKFAHLVVALLFASGIFSGKFDDIYRNETMLSYPGYRIVDIKNSIYGSIAIAERQGQFSLFYDGSLLATFGDKKTAEESVYFALLQREKMERVLLVGGGLDVVKEILKYGIAKIDYVELDPEIIKETEKILPSAKEIFGSRRVNVKTADARFFIKNTPEKYDCVIMVAPPPFSIKFNRFYTAEFFESVRKVLRKNGVFSFGMPSSENYINRELRLLFSSVYGSLKSVFPNAVAVPGFTAYFISSRGGKVTTDWRVLTARSAEKNLKPVYFRDYFLSSRMSPEKIMWMKKILLSGEGRRNLDSRPVSCYFGLLYWMSHFVRGSISLFLTSPFFAIVFSAGFLLIFALTFRGGVARAVLAGIFATGFTSMAIQITILLTFQIVYGFLFYKLGLLLTLFMAGLSVGSFFSLKMANSDGKLAAFGRNQKLIFLLPIFTAVLFYGGRALGGFFAAALFYFMPFFAGFLCGSQFPLANAVLLKGDVAGTSGAVYGTDLAASSIAAFLSGIFFMPILGIYGFCFFAALLDGIALILLFSYN